MLLGGLCGLTFWEDTNLTMAPLTQSLSRRACFPDQGRGGHRGGAAGTPWWLGRSCHPMQLALQLARPSRPNSVHKRPKTARRGPILPFVYTIAIPRPPTTQAHSPTVYTNAPKRRGEAVLANLCTLLRSHNCTRDRAGPLVPRRRRPHGPRDARALGPEAHAARVVTYPSIRVHDASYIMQFLAQFSVTKHNSV